MTEISPSHPVSLFHPLERETMKQTNNIWNTTRNTSETTSIKYLENNVLERNRTRNSRETSSLKSVSSLGFNETEQLRPSDPFLLREDFEERIAIAEYDGRQTNAQAHRIAYEGAIIKMLNDSPPVSINGGKDDWLLERVTLARHMLEKQGINQPG